MMIWRQRRPFTVAELDRIRQLVEPYTEFWTDGFWAGRQFVAHSTVTDWARVPERQQTVIQLMLDPAVDDWNYSPTIGVLKTQIQHWDKRLVVGGNRQPQDHPPGAYWIRLRRIRGRWQELLIQYEDDLFRSHRDAIHNQ